MYLHKDKAIFRELVRLTSEVRNVAPEFVVKDYFAVMMLREITRRNPAVVFKGGTCLSKCYGVIDRFSENVDLGMQEEHATQGMRKKMKQAVVESAAQLGVEIANLDKTRSRREFNRYLIDIPSADGMGTTDQLIVETAVMTPSSPAEMRPLRSFIGEYCSGKGFSEMVEGFDLGEFEVLANSLERTFCDKVFALCDYYLDGNIPQRQSRHLYDLHKLLGVVSLDESLAGLMDVVRSQRFGGFRSHSADPSVSLRDTLTRLLDEEAYRRDYERVTLPLLYEEVSYEDAACSLREIAGFLD